MKKFNLNLYTLLSILSAPKSLFGKDVDKRLDVRAQVAKEAMDNFENMTGRYDTIETVPSRTLFNVITEDKALVQELGARQNEKGEWVVPHGIPLSDFDLWEKPVPPDLIDKAPRMTRTRSGNVIEGYKLIADELQGQDSTAMPMMYAMLPVIGALAYIFGTVSTTLGWLTALLALPYVWTIAQSEGPKDAARSAVLLMGLPIALSVGLVTKTPGMSLVQGLTSGGTAAIASLGGAFLLCLLALVLGDSDKNKGFFGGAWEGFKKGMVWVGLIVGCISISLFMGGNDLLAPFQPLFIFAVACLYPMVYSEKEFVKRTEELKWQGQNFNLADQGALNNAHIQARRNQAESAANDETPFIRLGEAIGVMTRKEYGFAPDRSSPMGLTPLDMTMHTLVFGATGQGKTASMMRPIALAISELRSQGFHSGIYIDCGKGALGGDLEGITDICVKTGVPFAYYQGLDATGVSVALNTQTLKNERGDKDPIWRNGAKMLFDNILTIQEALVEHEKNIKKTAIRRMRETSIVIDKVEAELRASQDQEGVYQNVSSELQVLTDEYKTWEQEAIKPRDWFWNVECTERLRQMIDKPQNIDGVVMAGDEMQNVLKYLGYQASEKRMKARPDSVHPEIGQGFILDTSINYAMYVWPEMESEHRSSFMLNAKDILHPLLRGRSLVDADGNPWYRLEEGVRPEHCLYGKITSVMLSKGGDEGMGGVLVSALIKQRIYKLIRKRLTMKESDWRAEGQTPVMLLWDEVQALASSDDIELLPQARSAWVMAFFATQGFDSLVETLGRDGATLFANTFQSVICLRSSNETYEYLIKRMGTALMTTFPERTSGIDYEGSVKKYLDSPFNDRNHPNRAGMRKLEKQGAARFRVGRRKNFMLWSDKDAAMSDDEVSLGFVANIGGFKEIQPLFKPEEYTSLQSKGIGFAFLQRAGAPRVDMMKFGYVSADDLRQSKQQQEQGDAS